VGDVAYRVLGGILLDTGSKGWLARGRKNSEWGEVVGVPGVTIVELEADERRLGVTQGDESTRGVARVEGNGCWDAFHDRGSARAAVQNAYAGDGKVDAAQLAVECRVLRLLSFGGCCG
jgi:hypothetical protein